MIMEEKRRDIVKALPMNIKRSSFSSGQKLKNAFSITSMIPSGVQEKELERFGRLNLTAFPLLLLQPNSTD
jgi:hypothetical protein